MTIQIVLQKAASGKAYSLESGIADNTRNFDHHKPEHRQFPSPSNNEAIPHIKTGIIEISHLDADTFIGIIRFLGGDLPKIDLDLVEKIDLNGSSVCEDSYDPTLLYMVGVGALARSLKLPRCGDEPQDVTNLIAEMIETPERVIIDMGKAETDGIEDAYRNCILARVPGVGIYIIGANDSFDPSRPYKDGEEVVVVYRTHYKSISVYSSPQGDFQALGTWAGITFAGHPKACGSPRGEVMSPKQAQAVWSAIAVQQGQW